MSSTLLEHFKGLAEEEGGSWATATHITAVQGFSVTARMRTPLRLLKIKTSLTASVPQVRHSIHGNDMLRNFVRIYGATGDWSMDSFIEMKCENSRKKWAIRKSCWSLRWGRLKCGWGSLQKAIGDQLICIFVDHGFVRGRRPSDGEPFR